MSRWRPAVCASTTARRSESLRTRFVWRAAAAFGGHLRSRAGASSGGTRDSEGSPTPRAGGGPSLGRHCPGPQEVCVRRIHRTTPPARLARHHPMRPEALDLTETGSSAWLPCHRCQSPARRARRPERRAVGSRCAAGRQRTVRHTTELRHPARPSNHPRSRKTPANHGPSRTPPDDGTHTQSGSGRGPGRRSSGLVLSLYLFCRSGISLSTPRCPSTPPTMPARRGWPRSSTTWTCTCGRCRRPGRPARTRWSRSTGSVRCSRRRSRRRSR
jgi:hypothetical protein